MFNEQLEGKKKLCDLDNFLIDLKIKYIYKTVL